MFKKFWKKFEQILDLLVIYDIFEGRRVFPLKQLESAALWWTKRRMKNEP